LRETSAAETVARIVYSRNALANLEHSFQFLADDAPDAARGAVQAIQSAVDMLAHHPLIGRTVTAELRELIISYGRTGYVALYRFLPARREVRILAIRHQRELDYP
jgi:plasmid stabilization system protein ParE